MNTTLKISTIFRSLAATALLACAAGTTQAQTNTIVSDGSANHEYFGNTLNIGVGPGYFGATLMRSPYFTFNYEVDVLRNFTLAPFVGFSTYRSNPQVWGPRYYDYRGTIMPLGVKASYYFDEVIELPERWDLYAAGSLGYTIISKRWEDGYGGSVGTLPGIRPLFLDIHIGAEYQVTDATGIFLDLSTGTSVVGVGLHM